MLLEPANVILLLLVGLALSPLGNAASFPLSSPDGKVLFPMMHDGKEGYLPYYDVLLTRRYVPTDPDNSALTPSYMCNRNGYSVADVKQMFHHYPDFKKELLKWTGDPFWAGNILSKRPPEITFYSNKNLRSIEESSDKEFPPATETKSKFLKDNVFKDVLLFKRTTLLNLHGWVSDATFVDGSKSGMGQLCARRTWITKRVACSGRLASLTLWSRKDHPVYFGDARTMCRQTLGYDLPTRNEIESLSLQQNPPDCYDIQKKLGSAWVQSDVFYPAGKKPFFCMGCQLDFRQAYAVKSIDSNGNVICKGGFELERKAGVQPKCSHGFWEVDTIGRCRRILIVEANTIYELKAKTGDSCLPSQSFSISQLTGSFVKQSVGDLLSSYGTPLSFYRNNIAARGFCKRVCTPLYEDKMDYLNRNSGIVVCKPNYLWSCPRGGCARDGQPKPRVRCNNGLWLNLAECNPGHHGLIKFFNRVVHPPLLRRSHIHIIPQTASVQCEANFYESCSNKNDNDCAGGPKNIPLKMVLSMSPWVNLPKCIRFKLLHTGRISYATSSTSETAARAKWACEQHGMHLLSQVHVSNALEYSPNINGRRPIFDKVSSSWIESTDGTIHYFSQKTTYHSAQSSPTISYNITIKAEIPSTRRPFVCVKYNQGAVFGTGFDYSHTPERCVSDDLKGTGLFGLEKCHAVPKPPSAPWADPRFRQISTRSYLDFVKTGYQWSQKG